MAPVAFLNKMILLQHKNRAVLYRSVFRLQIRPQFLFVQNADTAPEGFHNAFLGKILNHTGDHFSGGAHVLGNLLLCHMDFIRLCFCHFVCEEDCQSFVHGHEKDLLHGPHNVGKTVCCHMIAACFYIDIFCNQLMKSGSADGEDF